MGGAIERVFVAPPIPTGGGKVIAAPFQFYTTGEDNLRVVSLNSVVGVTLKIQGRLVDNVGTLQASSWDHTPNSDRSVKTSEIALAPGAVLNLTVFANAGSPRIGTTFVQVQLIRGTGAGAVVLGTLLQGYVTATQCLAWPGSPLISSTDGEPNIRNIVGSTPAAGGNVSETCPANARWEVISLFVGFSCSGVAAARVVFLETVSGGNAFSLLAPGVNQTAGQFFDYVYAQNLPVFGVPSPAVEYMAIPQRMFLRGGDQIVVGAISLQAGDQFTAPFYQVREWLEAA